MEDKKYKVVVTGFGPFQNVAVNESWLAVSQLWEHDWPSNIKLVTRELPVVYDVVKSEVNNLWETEKPDLIIHCGVHRAGEYIYVEKQSFNENYVSNDINNQCPKDNKCVENGCCKLETKLDSEKLVAASNGQFEKICSKAKCAVSEDPGQYLCGYTYYLSLQRDNSKSLFVHVPSKNLFSIEDMTLALKTIIYESLNQLYGYKI